MEKEVELRNWLRLRIGEIEVEGNFDNKEECIRILEKMIENKYSKLEEASCITKNGRYLGQNEIQKRGEKKF